MVQWSTVHCVLESIKQFILTPILNSDTDSQLILTPILNSESPESSEKGASRGSPASVFFGAHRPASGEWHQRASDRMFGDAG